MSLIPDGEISHRQLVSDLVAIGLREGDHVALSVSLRGIGPIVGGAETLIDALLEVLTLRGTIVVPTYTQMFPLRQARSRRTSFVFDPDVTPGYTGTFAETLRRRPGALRSNHPTNSMAALGRFAGELTNDHNEMSGAYSPYSRLAALNGVFLGIGTQDRLVGLRHEAQARAGLLGVLPPTKGVKYRDSRGGVRLFQRKDQGGCTKTLPALVQPLRDQGVVTDALVGNAKSLRVPARDALVAFSELLQEDPTLNLCGDVGCLWCRETERRLNLFPRIKEPQWFQRARAARALISLVNAVRLRIWIPVPKQHLARGIFARRQG